MDVTYDSDKNTVHVVIGDVSMYKEGVQTVNLHDYNTVRKMRKSFTHLKQNLNYYSTLHFCIIKNNNYLNDYIYFMLTYCKALSGYF
jgi:hypothetical protein